MQIHHNGQPIIDLHADCGDEMPLITIEAPAAARTILDFAGEFAVVVRPSDDGHAFVADIERGSSYVEKAERAATTQKFGMWLGYDHTKIEVDLRNETITYRNKIERTGDIVIADLLPHLLSGELELLRNGTTIEVSWVQDEVPCGDCDRSWLVKLSVAGETISVRLPCSQG